MCAHNKLSAQDVVKPLITLHKSKRSWDGGGNGHVKNLVRNFNYDEVLNNWHGTVIHRPPSPRSFSAAKIDLTICLHVRDLQIYIRAFIKIEKFYVAFLRQ